MGDHSQTMATRERISFPDLLASPDKNRQTANHRGFIMAMLSLGPNTATALASTIGDDIVTVQSYLRSCGAQLMHRTSHNNNTAEKEFILRTALSRRPSYNDGSWRPGIG